MDDIHLEFDNKVDLKTEKWENLSNEQSQMSVVQLKEQEQNISTTDGQLSKQIDRRKVCPCPWSQQRTLIIFLVIVLIIITVTVATIVILTTNNNDSHTVTTVPPSTTTEWIPFPDSICRNETVATSVMLGCINFIAFVLMETDVEKCQYLDKAGSCALVMIEGRYRVNCTTEDQLAVFEANGELVNDFLQFNITARCGDLLG